MAVVFRWLHLSDFHQGQAEQSWQWPTVREHFYRDLTELYRRTGPWDLILFTGDLVNRGSAAEYAAFDETIAGLFSHIDGLGQKEQPLLLAVPGNHDLVRPSAKDPETKPLMPAVTLLSRGVQEAEALAQLFTDDTSPFRKLVEHSFGNYQTWWHRQPAARHSRFHQGLLPGDFSITIEKGGARLGIIGLNSASLQLCGGNFRGKLHLHERQVQVACKDDAPAWMKQHQACLLLTHHPPDWLDDESRRALASAIAPPQYVAAHIYGHMHAGHIETRSRGGSPNERSWQGFSLFGVEQTAEGRPIDRRHGYSIGELELGECAGSLRLFPRRATQSTSGAWHIHADRQEFRLQPDEGTRPEEFAMPCVLSPQHGGPARPAGHATAGAPDQARSDWQPTASDCASALANFRQEVARQSRFPRQLGLDSDETVRLLVGVTLDELYVIPEFQQERRFATLGEEAQALLHELGEPDLAPERRREVVARLNRLDHLRWIETSEKGESVRLPLRKAVDEWRHWVVLGTPGAGKSTLLQYLAGSCASADARQRELLGLSAEQCPLLVPLGEYAQALTQDKGVPLAAFLVARFAGRDRALQVAVHTALASGQAMVLLDALDEVPDEYERRMVSRAISDFLARHPAVRCVITSRPYGYEPVAGDVVHLRLPHFSAKEVAALIHRRQQAIERRRSEPDLGRAAATARAIFDQIEQHQSVAELARNPLLLVMICEICQRGQQLPVDRAQLYDLAIKTLLQRWNQWRAALPNAGESATARSVPLDEGTLLRAFGEVALRQHRRYRSRPVISQARLQHWLARALRHGGVPKEVATETARSYVQAAARRVGLLEERGPQQFVFWHQTLQEYLAATCLAYNPRQATHKILRIADSPHWHEVVQLALAYLGKVHDQPQRATRIVQALLSAHLPSLECATHRRLCLAASCLAHNPWLGADLADVILNRLATALLDMPFSPLASAFAAAARARSGLVPSASLIEALVRLCDRDYGYIGNAEVSLPAARIVANGTKRSQAARDWCERYLANDTTNDNAHTSFRRSSGTDQRIRCTAAMGLLQAGIYTPAVLIAIGTTLQHDQKFIDGVGNRLETLRASIEPVLDAWLIGEGPSLDITAAVLLSFLDRHDAQLLDVLLHEVCRSDSRFSEFGVDHFLHWHVRHSAEARLHLLSHLPQVGDRNNQRLGDLFHALTDNSDAFLTDLLALLAKPDSLVEKVLLWNYWHESAAEQRRRSRLVERLAPLLHDPDYGVRYRAACLCENLGHREVAMAALLACLPHLPPELQLQLAARLSNISPHYELTYYNRPEISHLKAEGSAIGPIVIEHLRQLLRSAHAEHRVRAAVLLSLLGRDDADDVIDVLLSVDAVSRAKQYGSPSYIAQRHPHRQTQIAAKMAEHLGNLEPKIRSAAQDYLSWYPPPTPAVLGVLRAYLESTAEPIRLAAAMVLFAAKDEDPRTYIVLLQGIHSLGAHQVAIVAKSLQELTAPSSALVSQVIKKLLGCMKDAVTYDRGAESEDQTQLDTAAPSQDMDRIAREIYSQDLAGILIAWSHRSGAVADAVVSKLTALLRTPQPDISQEAVRSVLSQLLATREGLDAKPIAEKLAAELKDEQNLTITYLVAEKLFFFGLCPQQTHEALRRCLASPSPRIRYEAACRLIPVAGAIDSSIVSALRSCLQSSDVALRWRVVLQLCRDPASLEVSAAALTSLLGVEKYGNEEGWLDLAFIDPDVQEFFSIRPADAQSAEEESPAEDEAAEDPVAVQLRYLEQQLEGREKAKPLCILAASQLRKLAIKPDQNIPLKQTLLSWLSHPDFRCIRALRYLLDEDGWSAEPQVENVLHAWLDSDTWPLRKAAVLILHRRPDKSALVEARLHAWLEGADTLDEEKSYEPWTLVMELAQQSDPLLHMLIRRYARNEGGSRHLRDLLWRMAQIQRDHVGAAIDRILSALPLREAVSVVELLAQLAYVTPSSPAVVVRAWASDEISSWPIDHLLMQFGRTNPEIAMLMVPYLDDTLVWRREAATDYLLGWGYESAPLAAVLRTFLKEQAPEVRYRACQKLQTLGDPADRSMIVATLRQLIAEDAATYATSEFLRPFESWPELTDLVDAAYCHSLNGGHRFFLDGIINYFVGRPQHHELLRQSLQVIAVTGHFRDATLAFRALRQLGLTRRTKLKILLHWLSDGDRESSLRKAAYEQLAGMRLLDKAVLEKSRHFDVFSRHGIFDERMEGLLILARSSLVPALFAEQIRPELGPPVERCRKGEPQAGDAELLADAVRLQASDSQLQKFARCWLFYWLQRRAKVLRAAQRRSMAALRDSS